MRKRNDPAFFSQKEGGTMSGSTEDTLKSLIAYLNNEISDTSECNKEASNDVTMTVEVEGVRKEEEEEGEGGGDEFTGPTVSPRMSLEAQFEHRCLFRVSPIEDGRFDPINWFSLGSEQIHEEHLVRTVS